jgi:(p)ppGpp synthase/HD superfamily hydrolase
MNGVALKELARSIAVIMHEKQCRKGTGEPYFNHVERVAQSVKGWQAQTVAYLHDVVEDTAVTKEDLLRLQFPAEVVNAVVALTRHAEGEETYSEFIERVINQPPSVRELSVEVKIADIRDNMSRLWEIPGDTSSKEKRYAKSLARLLEVEED